MTTGVAKGPVSGVWGKSGEIRSGYMYNENEHGTGTYTLNIVR